MAGNYPDSPGYRMPIDRDGTELVKVKSGVITSLTGAQKITLNDEGETALAEEIMDATNPTLDLVAVFPELRDLAGYFWDFQTSIGGIGTYAVSTSVDSTNGIDGTWVAQGVAVNANGSVKPLYRSNVISMSVPGIKAIRLRITYSSSYTYATVKAFHVYGAITAGQNPDRLELWHPTLNQRLGYADLDWGNVPRSSTADKTFRVKNRSATLTANAIVVAMDALTDTTPSVPAQHTLSNGGAFASSQNIGALAAGAISGVLTLRRVTPSDAVLSVWSMRVFAEAGSWT